MDTKAPKALQRWWQCRLTALRSRGLLPRDRTAELVISKDPSLRDSARHYAATSTRTLQVSIHVDAFDLPPRQWIAILLHELGHVIEHAGTAAGRKLMENPTAPTDEECRADWLAHCVFGVLILYDPRTKVQTLGNGILRPVGLK